MDHNCVDKSNKILKLSGYKHALCYSTYNERTKQLRKKTVMASYQAHKHIHHVCLLVSVRLIQLVNSVFLSQKTSTSQSKPAPAPSSEHAHIWRRFLWSIMSPARTFICFHQLAVLEASTSPTNSNSGSEEYIVLTSCSGRQRCR